MVLRRLLQVVCELFMRNRVEFSLSGRLFCYFLKPIIHPYYLLLRFESVLLVLLDLHLSVNLIGDLQDEANTKILRVWEVISNLIRGQLTSAKVECLLICVFDFARISAMRDGLCNLLNSRQRFELWEAPDFLKVPYLTAIFLKFK